VNPSEGECDREGGGGAGARRGAPAAACCDLLGFAAVCVPLSALPELRRQPGPVPGAPLPAGCLKQADEQTVVGLTAVCQAIHDHGLPTDFTDWGVLGAPRFLGRAALALALPRFLAEGAWGVSPHLIPHRSLHALSGTISLALKAQGPNFGVGGGPGAEAEVLLSALALLHGGRLPGVWVVMTRVEPDRPADEGGPPPHASYRALAVALAPARAERHDLRLRLLPGRGAPVPFDQGVFGEMIDRASRGEGPLTRSLGTAGRVEVSAPAEAPSARWSAWGG
jgi:hypothetical protein